MSSINGESLGEALPREMARVRDQVLSEYIKLGPPGVPASIMMRASLDAAQKALAEGDVIEMMRCYVDLQGYSL